ncbi:hypothetical protein ACHAXN_009078 [Cyclotella atomus]
MNSAENSCHVFGNQLPNPITFGQVAAHAETFSQTSSLPTSFGKYDSFYLSLRGSGNDSQRQQKQWLRRHHYRGDERVKGHHGIARRRMERQQQHKYPTSPFSSPEKMKDMYEDDDIEAERGCALSGDSCGMDTSRTSEYNNQSEDTQTEQSRDDQQFMEEAAEVSPTTSPFASINLQPKVSAIKPNTNLNPRKREMEPMDLDEAFMELTLNMNPSLVTPDATSISDNLKLLSPADDDSTALSSSLEPAVHSRRSSLCSNLNAQLEYTYVSQGQLTPESSAAACSSPAKHGSSATSSPQFALTPLSKAIVSKRGLQSTISSTKVRNSPTQSPTMTTTPKRKPRGAVSSSSKRRRRESNTSTTSSVRQPTPRKLYNGKALERINDIRKCNDKNCRWDPNLHKLKAACERCWTLASESEQNFFVENGGRHLRINLVRGGCPSTCKLFSHRVKVPIDGNDDEDIRLCRKCFDDMHHVGIRKSGP